MRRHHGGSVLLEVVTALAVIGAAIAAAARGNRALREQSRRLDARQAAWSIVDQVLGELTRRSWQELSDERLPEQPWLPESADRLENPQLTILVRDPGDLPESREIVVELRHGPASSPIGVARVVTRVYRQSLAAAGAARAARLEGR